MIKEPCINQSHLLSRTNLLKSKSVSQRITASNSVKKTFEFTPIPAFLEASKPKSI